MRRDAGTKKTKMGERSDEVRPGQLDRASGRLPFIAIEYNRVIHSEVPLFAAALITYEPPKD